MNIKGIHQDFKRSIIMTYMNFLNIFLFFSLPILISVTDPVQLIFGFFDYLILILIPIQIFTTMIKTYTSGLQRKINQHCRKINLQNKLLPGVMRN